MQDNSSEWVQGLSKSEKSSLRAYTGDDFFDINHDLRAGQALPGNLGKISRNMDSALERTSIPEDIVVYRGQKSAGMMEQSVDDPQQAVGHVYEDKGYVSTGLEAGTGTASNFRFELEIPKGSQGALVSPFSQHAAEYELILPRNSKFEITYVDERIRPELPDEKPQLFVRARLLERGS